MHSVQALGLIVSGDHPCSADKWWVHKQTVRGQTDRHGTDGRTGGRTDRQTDKQGSEKTDRLAAKDSKPFQVVQPLWVSKTCFHTKLRHQCDV